jgi:hypothetical protein
MLPMRKKRPDVLTRNKVKHNDPRYQTARDDWAGVYVVRGPLGDHLFLMIGPGEPAIVWLQSGFDFPAWDHVSVSVAIKSPEDMNNRRLPTWEEMHYVKRLCWDDEETVIQIHAPADAYVNENRWVLHLWKPIGIEIPLPPTKTIGSKVTGYESR